MSTELSEGARVRIKGFLTADGARVAVGGRRYGRFEGYEDASGDIAVVTLPNVRGLVRCQAVDVLDANANPVFRTRLKITRLGRSELEIAIPHDGREPVEETLLHYSDPFTALEDASLFTEAALANLHDHLEKGHKR